MNSDPLVIAKARLRREARDLRRTLHNPEAGSAVIAHWPEAWLHCGPVAGYWPLGNELDSRPLLQHLAAQGVAVALPRMLERNTPPVFLPWDAQVALSADAFGILAPGEGQAVVPRLILTPLLAFDRKGGRLGQGGGHYDRVLAGLRPSGVLAVGLAFAGQEVAEVPLEPHDQRLDWVLTEAEAIRCG